MALKERGKVRSCGGKSICGWGGRNHGEKAYKRGRGLHEMGGRGNRVGVGERATSIIGKKTEFRQLNSAREGGHKKEGEDRRDMRQNLRTGKN